MATPQKPVLIAGAGISSLLLAQSLLRSRIPFQVFERDASISFRGQGYRLRLSDEGMNAIESVLENDYQKFYDICGKTGGSGFAGFDAVTGEKNEASTANETLTSKGGLIVGVSRGDMRKFFLRGTEDHIQFGKYVKGYELVDDGVQLLFHDGTKSDVGSMLVGGEGIKSSTAKQVSGGRIKIYDTGARGIHGQAPTTAFRGLGEGVFRLTDQTNPNGVIGIMTNVRSGDMDDPNIEFGWTMGGPPGTIKAPGDDYSIIGKQAADIAKALTKNWHPRFKPLFDEMNEADAAFWKITCSRPSGVPEWPNEPRVTVIGDAAHNMTPAGGIGANTAVQDSALLGRLLREAGGYKKGVTAEYEKGMRVYGSAAVAKSYGLAEPLLGIKIDEATTPTVEPSHA
jgi:2-polyprenyl-6-methoxyphenol hydroxylase-like FAD-dependent oxidoreductase